MRKVKENEKPRNRLIFCGNCGRELGAVDADCQSFSIYNSPLTVWDTTRFICKCNKPYWFRPQDPIDESSDEQTFTYKVLNGVGKVYSQSKKGKSQSK